MENNTGKSGWSGCFQQTQQLKARFWTHKNLNKLVLGHFKNCLKKVFLQKNSSFNSNSSKNTPHTWRKRAKRKKKVYPMHYTLTILQQSACADRIFMVRPELSTTVKYTPDFLEWKIIVLTHLNLVSKPGSLAHKHKTKVKILFLDSNSPPEGRHIMAKFSWMSLVPNSSRHTYTQPTFTLSSLPTATTD